MSQRTEASGLIGLFVDAAGVLYIADAFNARIRALHFAEPS